MLLGWLLCLVASSLFSCAAASFFGEASAAADDLPSPGLRPAALAAGQLWMGSYTCHTPAWLLLHIEMVNATGLRAVFQFVYPSTAQTGSFIMHGTFGSGGMVKQGFFQRQIMPQAARSFCQPLPISQPLGPRWPAISGLFFDVGSGGMIKLLAG
eukprot:scaffold84207_cov56-Phaeocystis_antarctica.AAC.4